MVRDVSLSSSIGIFSHVSRIKEDWTSGLPRSLDANLIGIASVRNAMWSPMNSLDQLSFSRQTRQWQTRQDHPISIRRFTTELLFHTAIEISCKGIQSQADLPFGLMY